MSSSNSLKYLKTISGSVDKLKHQLFRCHKQNDLESMIECMKYIDMIQRQIQSLNSTKITKSNKTSLKKFKEVLDTFDELQLIKNKTKKQIDYLKSQRKIVDDSLNCIAKKSSCSITVPSAIENKFNYEHFIIPSLEILRKYRLYRNNTEILKYFEDLESRKVKKDMNSLPKVPTYLPRHLPRHQSSDSRLPLQGEKFHAYKRRIFDRLKKIHPQLERIFLIEVLREEAHGKNVRDIIRSDSINTTVRLFNLRTRGKEIDISKIDKIKEDMLIYYKGLHKTRNETKHVRRGYLYDIIKHGGSVKKNISNKKKSKKNNN